MRAKSFADMKCSIAGALEAIGDRWGFLIMRDLTFGLSRYDEFQESMGIPAQTLATRLKQLEAAGLVERRQYQDRPPRDEYRLTPKGRDFWIVLTALRQWGDDWNMHGAEGPPLALTNKKSGHSVRLGLIDSQANTELPVEHVMPVPGPGADGSMKFRLKAK